MSYSPTEPNEPTEPNTTSDVTEPCIRVASWFRSISDCMKGILNMSKNFEDLKAEVTKLIELVKKAIDAIKAGGNTGDVDAETARVKASADELDAALKGVVTPPPPPPPAFANMSPEARLAARRAAGG